jgi:hypothetical protein
LQKVDIEMLKGLELNLENAHIALWWNNQYKKHAELKVVVTELDFNNGKQK